MADLFSVTAPLLIRFRSGEKRIMVERFAHPEGLVFLEPFWTEQDPALVFHQVTGELHGEGPWKLGDAVITVLGCQGTDPEMAALYAQWQSHRQHLGPRYPSPEEILALAREQGALPGGSS